MKPTLCMTHFNKYHKIQSTPYSDSLFNLKQKILASNSTTCEYLASNDADIDILIEVYKSSNPTEKTLSKINKRIMKRPVTVRTIQMLLNFLVHKNVLPFCWQTEKKIVSFLLNHMYHSIKLNVTINNTCISAILDSGSTYSIL